MNLKKLHLALFSLILPASIFAGVSSDSSMPNPYLSRGYYINVVVGYSNANYSNSYLAPGFSASSYKNNGPAGRIALGYQFNSYIGTEFSVTFMTHVKVNNLTGSSNKSNGVMHNLVGFFANVGYPFNRHLRLAALLGLGYISRGGIDIGSVTVLKKGCLFSPQYGVEGDYQFGRHWIANITWLQAAGNRSDQLPFANFVGMGLRILM